MEEVKCVFESSFLSTWLKIGSIIIAIIIILGLEHACCIYFAHAKSEVTGRHRKGTIQQHHEVITGVP